MTTSKKIKRIAATTLFGLAGLGIATIVPGGTAPAVGLSAGIITGSSLFRGNRDKPKKMRKKKRKKR